MASADKHFNYDIWVLNYVKPSSVQITCPVCDESYQITADMFNDLHSNYSRYRHCPFCGNKLILPDWY